MRRNGCRPQFPAKLNEILQFSRSCRVPHRRSFPIIRATDVATHSQQQLTFIVTIYLYYCITPTMFYAVSSKARLPLHESATISDMFVNRRPLA